MFAMLFWMMFVVVVTVEGQEFHGMDTMRSLEYTESAKQIIVDEHVGGGGGGPGGSQSQWARHRTVRVRQLIKQGKTGEALQEAHEILGIDPLNGELWGWVGVLSLHSIRGKAMSDERELWLQVLQPLIRAHQLSRGVPRERMDPQILFAQLLQQSPRPFDPFSLAVFPHKLRNDMAYAKFLQKERLLPDTLVTDLVDRYTQVLNVITTPYDSYYVLAPSQWELLAPYYARVLYTPSAPKLPGPALNPDLNFHEIESTYWAAEPNFVVIDNFFSDAALQGLLRHSQRSSFVSQRPGFVANFLTEGAGSELLAQVIAEMRKKMPTIFCSTHRLFHGWMFKYDDKLNRAIEKHADAAAVNFNVWLSPNEGNLDPESGGLDIWPVLPPTGWRTDDYNNFHNLTSLEKIIEGKQPHRVPHRQNRAILFQSELIHASQPMRWKEGYTTRRINLTLLFGKMAESQLCKPH